MGILSFFDVLIFLGQTVASGTISYGQEGFFDKIFGKEIKYNSFYDQIRNIVRNELILNDLPKYQGMINGVENNLNNDYEKNKNILSYKENEHKLSVFSNEILSTINILEDEYYKDRSEVIAIYMEASYLYLYLQQEIVRQIDLVIAKREKISGISDIGRKKENTISVIKDEAKRFKASLEKYFISLLQSRMKHYSLKPRVIGFDLSKIKNNYFMRTVYIDDLSFEIDFDVFSDTTKKRKEILENRLQTVLLIKKFFVNMDKLQNSPVPVVTKDIIKNLKIQAEANCYNKGWLGYKDSNMTIGTTGESRGVVLMRMKITQAPENSPNIGIEYRTFFRGSGWCSWVRNGMDSWNDDKHLVTAIQIRLINNKSDYKIIYRSHLEKRGWSEWVCEGETAGVTYTIQGSLDYMLDAFEFTII